MERFTKEEITKTIERFEKIASDNPKHCTATATGEVLERVRDYFKPPNQDVIDGACKINRAECTSLIDGVCSIHHELCSSTTELYYYIRTKK